MGSNDARREFLRASAAAGAGMFLVGCGRFSQTQPEQKADAQPGAEKGDEEKGDKEKEGGEKGEEGEGVEVTATEDLMREHGVLRRALLVYTAAASRLRTNPASVPPEALQKTATLFRAFGEEYHEKKLEEAFIFPAVRKAGGEAATYPDVLVVQHDRGREITDYILAVTRGVKLGAAGGAQLAGVLDAFVLMYQHHAAREDTIVFPAWMQTLSDAQLDEMDDKFEEIETEQFGEDGYETAVKQIADIEAGLGIADISQFTPQPPPRTAGG
jgi:hemerythrin-like domain-containing protein